MQCRNLSIPIGFMLWIASATWTDASAQTSPEGNPPGEEQPVLSNQEAIEEEPVAGESPEEPPSEAQALFIAGNAAVRDGRYADARDLYRRSIQIAPRLSVAWNLVLAFRGTNEIIAALELVEQLIGGDFGELSSEDRPELEALHAELEGRVSTLNIRTNHPSSVELAVDDVAVGTVDPGDQLVHLIIPGEHRIVGTAAEIDPVERTIETSEGDVTDVLLTFTPRRPVWRRAWFWVVTVGLPVVIGSSIALWLTLRDRDEPGMTWQDVAAWCITTPLSRWSGDGGARG